MQGPSKKTFLFGNLLSQMSSGVDGLKKNENVLKNNSMVSGSYPFASFNLAKKYRNFWEDDVFYTRKKVAKTFSSNAVILNPTKQSSYIPSK